jgi:hypothetical protein
MAPPSPISSSLVASLWAARPPALANPAALWQAASSSAPVPGRARFISRRQRQRDAPRRRGGPSHRARWTRAELADVPAGGRSVGALRRICKPWLEPPRMAPPRVPPPERRIDLHRASVGEEDQPPRRGRAMRSSSARACSIYAVVSRKKKMCAEDLKGRRDE